VPVKVWLCEEPVNFDDTVPAGVYVAVLPLGIVVVVLFVMVPAGVMLVLELLPFGVKLLDMVALVPEKVGWLTVPEGVMLTLEFEPAGV